MNTLIGGCVPRGCAHLAGSGCSPPDVGESELDGEMDEGEGGAWRQRKKRSCCSQLDLKKLLDYIIFILAISLYIIAKSEF